jgi:hypothetical protein
MMKQGPAATIPPFRSEDVRAYPGAAQAAVDLGAIVTGKNRIMIYAPKDDGTYVVEFRTAERRRAGDLDPQDRGACDPALSRADALWAVRAGGGGRLARCHEFQIAKRPLCQTLAPLTA